jgi:hypothetical protein
MAWTKTKTAIVVGVVALLATGTTTFIVCKHSARPRLQPTREVTTPGAKILVFRNTRSWNRTPDFEEALATLHIKFDVKSSAHMGNAELSDYDVVIVPGDQREGGYYRDYARNAAVFDGFVSKGGTLVFELNGAEREGITLPGNVKMVSHGAVDNQILQPEHSVLAPLHGKPIHANWASHGYLTGVPPDATILAVEMFGLKEDMSKPTFVEYSRGSGRIIAACQCFHDRDGSGRGPMMPAVIKYASAKQWFSPR